MLGVEVRGGSRVGEGVGASVRVGQLGASDGRMKKIKRKRGNNGSAAM